MMTDIWSKEKRSEVNTISEIEDPYYKVSTTNKGRVSALACKCCNEKLPLSLTKDIIGTGETMDNPAYPLELLQRNIRVSMDTTLVVQRLPTLRESELTDLSAAA